MERGRKFFDFYKSSTAVCRILVVIVVCIYIYIYERETSVCMCYTITVKQKTQRLTNFRILLILSHVCESYDRYNLCIAEILFRLIYLKLDGN